MSNKGRRNKRGNFTGSIDSYLQQQEVLSDWEISGDFRIWQRRMEEEPSFWFTLFLALTFGFTLLTTDVAIGRKTGQSPLNAYRMIHPKWGGLGILACIIPVVILPYYCSIGGWVLKYLKPYHRTWGGSRTGRLFYRRYT